MKNQSRQCLCEAKGVTFISSYAYCEKCRKQLPAQKSSGAIIEPNGAPIQEISEKSGVYKERRVGFGIY
ncbi:MAG: hypothetical protein M3384_05900 [Acidobacteriota bacterium]|nr:hypothetical protein [Acidobacteriota bacterium]